MFQTRKPETGRRFPWIGRCFVVGMLCLLPAILQIVMPRNLSGQVPDQNISSRRELSNNVGSLSADDSIQSLIQQLGADDYVDRELAEVEIGRLGVAALEPLKHACSPQSSHSDPEIRLRAKRLLILIFREDFRRRESEFLAAEESDPGDFMFVGWREFSEIVGGNRSSRHLFMRMYQSQEHLFLAFAQGKAELEKEIKKVNSIRLVSDRNSGRLLSRLCSLMFLATHSFSGVGSQQGRLSTETRDLAMICSQLCDAENLAYVRSSDSTSGIEKIVDHWFTAVVVHSDVPVELRLEVVEKYHLANQLEFLMEIVGEPNQLTENRQRALQLVTALGDRSHVTLLRPLLEDSSLVGRFPNPELEGEAMEVQFRDLVLVSCVHLAGADPTDFGFLPAMNEDEDSQSLLDPTRSGFANQALRESALAKWYRYRDADSD